MVDCRPIGGGLSPSCLLAGYRSSNTKKTAQTKACNSVKDAQLSAEWEANAMCHAYNPR